MDNIKQSCACKGIRKCAICIPKEQQSLVTDDIKLKYYNYCQNCGLCHLIQNIEDFNEIECNHDLEANIRINGILLIQNFIDENEEIYLVDEINKSKWIDSQSGRFKQDYGPKVNFKKKKLKLQTFTGLPSYSKLLINRLNSIKNEILKDFSPIELCNLLYKHERGASIDPHFDDFWLWGERLVTINLLSDTFLTLTRILENVKIEILIPLKRFSLIVLYSDARYKWMHEIKRNHINNTRVAITLRELTEEFKCDPSGKYLENMAFSFKGVSVGELEEFFQKHEKLEDYNDIRFPDVGDNEIKESIRKNFDFDKISLKRLNESDYFTYLMNKDGNNDSFIVKIFDKNFVFKKLEYTSGFINYLALNSSNFKVERIISSNNYNSCINKLENFEYMYWIQEYINGEHVFDDEIWFKMGQIVSNWRLMSSEVYIFLLFVYALFRLFFFR
jgi:alkylated DNA repair protein alkB family protein 4